MTIVRTRHRFVLALVFWLAVAGATLGAQDTLARAKDFYASAAYEEALQVLQRLHGRAPAVEANEVAAYQLFCLVALGRSDEAKHAIETIVRTDPLYRLSEAQASPRVRAFFDDVRRPLLPEIVKQSYSKAKDAFERKDMSAATAEFDRVIAVIDEIGAASDRGLADLRTLASGFRDLSKAPTPPPQPTAAPAAPAGNVTATAAATSSPPSPTADTVPTYGARDVDVIRPVAISRALPEWRPNTVEAVQDFRGSLELLIDADGKVLSAVITDSIHPRYDPLLVRAAQEWKFRPAMKNGKPVKYRYALDLQLKR